MLRKYNALLAMFLFLTVFLVPVLGRADSNQARHLNATGLWRNPEGTTIVKIEECFTGLCGHVYQTSFAIYDEQNPDPQLRHRLLTGILVLKTTKIIDENSWEGEVYQFANGKKYIGTLKVVNDQILEIQGCIMYGYVCQSSQWTRVTENKTFG